MNDQDVKRINVVLARMQNADPKCRVFGSTHHKYRLGPTVSEEAILEFEHNHEIAIPDDYRFFLKQVGNGHGTAYSDRYYSANAGAGPGYGILPFTEVTHMTNVEKPFPLLNAMPKELLHVGDQWDEEEPYPGLLILSTAGCTYKSCLVVNGSSYGTIWNLNSEPMLFYPTNMSFEAWYMSWLDKLTDVALPKLANEPIIDLVRVGLSKSDVIEICGGIWEEVVYAPGRKILRFQHLAANFYLDHNDIVDRIDRCDIYVGDFLFYRKSQIVDLEH